MCKLNLRNEFRLSKRFGTVNMGFRDLYVTLMMRLLKCDMSLLHDCFYIGYHAFISSVEACFNGSSLDPRNKTHVQSSNNKRHGFVGRLWLRRIYVSGLDDSLPFCTLSSLEQKQWPLHYMSFEVRLKDPCPSEYMILLLHSILGPFGFLEF